MSILLRLCAASAVTLVFAAAGALAQPTRIDVVTPIAPELAAYGPSAIGVRTLTAVDRDRPDVLRTKEGEPTARYDRRFVLEVWYPATLAPGETPGGTYHTVARDPTIAVTLQGQAVRDATLATAGGPFPLVILSHGYPGNRYLMSHLGENLASKGFIVVSIDHADSTYEDQQAFASTLYNRPFDQLFVLDEMTRLAAPGSGSFLSGRPDTSRTGLVGYSMGGYGVINAIGGGYSAASLTMRGAPPNRLLGERAAANPAYRALNDTRVKAVIAIGPWGMQAGIWDAEGLGGIRTPVLFVAGSVDDVSGYAKGTRALFEGVVNADRYLLTFVNANHNAAAPHPAPTETLGATGPAVVAYTQHADAVWDTVRMNNILQHFATAYFDRHLKGDDAKQAYFDVVASGTDAVYAVDREGRELPGHTYWKGFKRGTAVALTLEHATPAPGAR
ncbi:putative dienelactone hydrolase [Luteitalea pratensis]|uniref:Putative dienelactone hydrolase n=1 Tax=Luteitalea pratensis TaxID=1855912 RepID=A0A143PJL7_LUTPR|nr:dienelactone hydrolase [Luteitalea pratensis]AMY08691.1 putative dienelactone hydrolase [Luteitalea pratensis]